MYSGGVQPALAGGIGMLHSTSYRVLLYTCNGSCFILSIWLYEGLGYSVPINDTHGH